MARWLASARGGRGAAPRAARLPGHAIWARDFTGSASVFSIVLGDDWTAARTTRLVDALRLFRIGFSWGGVTSLVMAYLDLPRLGARRERLVRLNVGLEEPADLIDDLRRALERA